MTERDGDATRDRIESLVRQEPGLHKSALCRELGLGWGTVGHHLRILRSQGRLHSVREGRELRIYPAGVPADDMRLMVMLRDDTALEILQHLNDQPGGRLTDIARALGLSRKVVRRHLDNLEVEELVQPRGEFQRRYHIGPDADIILETGAGWDLEDPELL